MRFLSIPQRLRRCGFAARRRRFLFNQRLKGVVQTFVGGFIAAVTLM
jgi:hypothetical protein